MWNSRVNARTDSSGNAYNDVVSNLKTSGLGYYMSNADISAVRWGKEKEGKLGDIIHDYGLLVEEALKDGHNLRTIAKYGKTKKRQYVSVGKTTYFNMGGKIYKRCSSLLNGAEGV